MNTRQSTHPDNKPAEAQQSLRDPREWKTGDEPITAAQRSYLETLATEAREPADDLDALSKAEASIRIDELRQKTGRGDHTNTSEKQ